MSERLSAFADQRASAGRVTGPPPSANGASSFHLQWDLPGHYAAASVQLCITEPPRVPRLSFWALQASFATPRPTAPHESHGAAHLGLQWHPSHPGSRAVNWGGYGRDGAELAGTSSPLPSALANANTRDLHWEPNRSYELRIERQPTSARSGSTEPVRWRGSLVEPERGTTIVIRDLSSSGSHLASLCMWSEIFAHCDDPSSTIHWRNPRAWDDDGIVFRPRRCRVSYQSHPDGGCANTNSSVDERGFVQQTNVERTTPDGAWLRVPAT